MEALLHDLIITHDDSKHMTLHTWSSSMFRFLCTQPHQIQHFLLTQICLQDILLTSISLHPRASFSYVLQLQGGKPPFTPRTSTFHISVLLV